MDRPLLQLKTALVFLLAALSGTAAAALSWLAGDGSPRSALAGLAVAGLAIPFFDRLIASGEDAGVCGKAEHHG
ncbi:MULTISPECIES: hypothetical protein [unclassified Streptomyces]|uniref:hypothetical protein n=1 Tax=unclassified Streptomyces TaxID=2593676 RepID=UPI00093919DE|nr:hypothetical protein [Streptomyces sp. TSRI0281]OKI32425.1 hypothetical protein A6A29_21735 [Streptomyces sp. TSRI0281]